MSDCVPLLVPDLMSFLDSVVGSVSASVTNSDFRFCVSQTHFFSEMRSASGTLVCDQIKRQE